AHHGVLDRLQVQARGKDEDRTRDGRVRRGVLRGVGAGVPTPVGRRRGGRVAPRPGVPTRRDLRVGVGCTTLRFTAATDFVVLGFAMGGGAPDEEQGGYGDKGGAHAHGNCKNVAYVGSRWVASRSRATARRAA